MFKMAESRADGSRSDGLSESRGNATIWLNHCDSSLDTSAGPPYPNHGLMKTRHNSVILGLRVLADLLRSRSGVTAQTT